MAKSDSNRLFGGRVSDWKNPCGKASGSFNRNTDGFLPVLKDGKWGICTDSETFIHPKFDQLDICSEDCLKARIGSRWGWVTENGDLTEDQRQAAIGSWYDIAK